MPLFFQLERRLRMKKIRSFIYILLSGMLWGCMGVFVRVLNKQGIASMDIVFLRAIVTAVAMVIFLFIFHRRMLKIHWKDFWCFLGTGIASITFFNFCHDIVLYPISRSVYSKKSNSNCHDFFRMHACYWNVRPAAGYHNNRTVVWFGSWTRICILFHFQSICT